MRFPWLCLVSICFLSCNGEKEIYIKSINIGPGLINWYMYSLITSDSPDYVEFSEGKTHKILFQSNQLTNVRRSKDSLIFQVEGSYGKPRVVGTYKFIDSNFIKGLGLNPFIDTTGYIENSSSYRLPRIQKAKVDIFKPHFFNSDYRGELSD